jgi:hypothetical protein
MTKPKAIIESWIELVNAEGRNLSKWEQDFMDSLTEQFEARGSISDRQEEILERIYSERTS